MFGGSRVLPSWRNGYVDAKHIMEFTNDDKAVTYEPKVLICKVRSVILPRQCHTEVNFFALA